MGCLNNQQSEDMIRVTGQFANKASDGYTNQGLVHSQTGEPKDWRIHCQVSTSEIEITVKSRR